MYRVRKQIGDGRCTNPQVSGEGVAVAVLDSGIAAHPDLSRRVLEFRDFVNGKEERYDDCGHGTHVCGIISGDGALSAGRNAGMAPGAKLVVGKVLNEKGDGCTEHMLAALKWIDEIAEVYGIRILNVSIGIGDLSDEEKESKLRQALDVLWDKGMTVVCAAGNKGPENGSISKLATGNKLITVGCHDGTFFGNHPKRCDTYSGRGRALSVMRKPDVVAPGTEIVSCNNVWNQLALNSGNLYTAKSGTSMATPIVSGALALAMEKFPHMTNEELKQKLTLTASDLGEPWNKQGWGMINVRRLLLED